MPTPADPVLVGCAHGTRDPAGRRSAALLRLEVSARRPGIRVLAASVDVQRPALAEVVARVTSAGRRCVVVPLLLSAGYHVRTDVGAAVAAGGELAVAAGALGPDPDLVQVLIERLGECGRRRGDAVVLAAAGSSDPLAVRDVEVTGQALAVRIGTAVTAAYLSGAVPHVRDAVAAARAAGRDVSVAAYLLSPGFFADRLAAVGADRVSAPLTPHPLLADLVLRRFDSAVAAAGWSSRGPAPAPGT